MSCLMFNRRGAVFVNLSLSNDKPHLPLVSSCRHRRLLSDYTGKGGGGDVDRERERRIIFVIDAVLRRSGRLQGGDGVTLKRLKKRTTLISTMDPPPQIPHPPPVLFSPSPLLLHCRRNLFHLKYRFVFGGGGGRERTVQGGGAEFGGEGPLY